MQPLLQWKRNKYYIFWVRIGSFRYPARNAHAPYCHLSPARSTTFFRIISWTSGKRCWTRKVCFDFLYNSVWNISHSKTKWSRYDQKRILVSTFQVPVILVRFLMKLEFSRQIFEKYSSIKFNESPSSGRWVVPCEKTDRHAEANSRCTQFCGRAKWPIKCVVT